jgi:hypothetical protein
MSQGVGGRLGSAVGADLQVKIRDVSLDCAGAQEQFCADLAAAFSGGDEAQYLNLPLGQAVRVVEGRVPSLAAKGSRTCPRSVLAPPSGV